MRKFKSRGVREKGLLEEAPKDVQIYLQVQEGGMHIQTHQN